MQNVRTAEEIRDASRHVATDMGLPADLPENTQLQFARAYWLTKEVLSATGTPSAKLLHIHKHRTAAVDQICEHAKSLGLAEINGQLSRATVACKSGCSTCCHQNVSISASEAIVIALFLKFKKRPVRPILAQTAARIAHLTIEQRYAAGVACAFLKDRKCSIYTVRPGACAAYLSLSLQACLASWARRAKPDSGVPIPLVAEASIASTGIFMGSNFALAEHGFQNSYGELTAMVARAAEPGIAEAWLDGQSVFPDSDHTRKYQGQAQALFDAVGVTGELVRARTNIPGLLIEESPGL